MAVRHFDGRPVDIGASYFTSSDPIFGAVVGEWEARRLVRPWTNTFTVLSPEGERQSTGPMRWAAPSGLRSLVEDLARGLVVASGVTVAHVERVDGSLQVDGRTADAVVLAMPDPQARRLLSDELGAEAAALTDEFEPVLALTARWARRSWADRDGVFVNGNSVLGWVADDGLRRGDRSPVLVAHSTAEFARSHLSEPDAAVAPMVAALCDTLGITDQPELAVVNRWTFAKPAGRRDQSFLLSDSGLGVCGDSWSVKPRVESAFLSGRRLGQAIGAWFA